MLFWRLLACGILLLRTGRTASSVKNDEECIWTKAVNSPNIYWINMDKSVDRRVAMEQHLDNVVGPNKHFRVRGFGLDDIYIPADVEKLWTTHQAKYDTSEDIPHRSSVKKGSKFWPYKVILSSLYGRKKHNRIKEIGCTVSHLYAMRQAINENPSPSKYALIIEDDVQFLFDVDWDALVATAPSNWGIIQLFNSNKDTLSARWGDYQKKQKKGEEFLWVEKWPNQPVAYWSTCAYLINKAVMGPIVDKILKERNGWDDVKLIAGTLSPPVPKNSPCVRDTNGTLTYSMEPPCIWSPKGFQADAFLYSMTKSWVFNVPLIANGAGGNQSTFHQDHVVSIHQAAFSKLSGILNSMMSGSVTIPSFIRPACPGKVLAEMALSVTTADLIPS